MTSDIFAKLGDIKGESLDSKHKDEVEVLSWSWGVNQSGTIAQGGGGDAGKANFNDFNFTHHVERSTSLIAPDGTLAREWRKVKVDGHAAEVLAAIKAL